MTLINCDLSEDTDDSEESRNADRSSISYFFYHTSLNNLTRHDATAKHVHLIMCTQSNNKKKKKCDRVQKCIPYAWPITYVSLSQTELFDLENGLTVVK